ncbi:UNVERIFIED_CONTAM: hypothetical protein GTU68_035708 [Idotea baltica]|nr:hypothetical protein [Idotea baltica]
MKIDKLDAFQIFDSRGNPTIETIVRLDSGIEGRASVPSGASRGKYEALELRDGDPSRFRGKSVFQAIGHVQNEINDALSGRSVEDQRSIDELLISLDGTDNKSRLGANAMLGTSMATARAAAAGRNLPLFRSLTNSSGTLIPIPEIQIIGGGAHSGGRIDVQDFMIICNGAKSYSECLEMTFNVYHECGILLKEQNKLSGLADEGGYWPEFETNEAVFDIILRAIERSGYKPGADISFSLDVAASELFADGAYHLRLEEKRYSPRQFYSLMSEWCENYPIISLEDPFAEDDLANWEKLTADLGSRVNIIGDDLFTTDINRVHDGISRRLANSVLIKLNQIGTVTETMDCIRATQEAGWLPVVSARSGETEDSFIAHLAVATDAGQLKVGSFARGERMVKWNEILRIERALKGESMYIGAELFDRSS